MFCNVAMIKPIDGKLGNSALGLPSLGIYDTLQSGGRSLLDPHTYILKSKCFRLETMHGSCSP